MRVLFIGVAAALAFAGATAEADQTITAAKAYKAPVIDGDGSDEAWARAKAFTVQDAVADIPLTLKAVHVDGSVYVLTSFADKTESRDHKTMVWDKTKNAYVTGPAREDSFVLKWNMEPHQVDLTLSSDAPYKADIWYWKSHRTDHAGYADDKHQVYNQFSVPKAKKTLSKKGRVFYLLRAGDDGKSAYGAALIGGFQGDKIGKFKLRAPTGSRADVRAKGAWKDGVWTVEFGRKLDTGHADDIQFVPGKSYQFGVSRYEIAGRKRDDSIDEPLFGSGEIGETLFLEFE